MGLNQKPIVFFIGSSTADNIQVLLDNLSFMLGDKFDIHLVSTTPNDIEKSVKNSFCTFDGEYAESMRGGFKALWAYHQYHDPKAVVQLTSPPIHGFTVGSVAKKYGIKSVYRYSGDRFHAHKYLSGKKKITAFTVNNIIGLVTLKLFDNYIALGPAGKNRLIQRGVDSESVTILPPSINRNRIQEIDDVATIEISSSKSIALFLGRLHPLKGLRTLKRTIPEILSHRDDIHFLFVGENFGFDFLPDLREHITIVGRVAPDKVAKYLRLADVLIHPSLTEGLPRVILESLVAGTPVIARDVGDISSVTKNTFTTDAEFVNLVCQFEELPLDDVKPFSRTELKPKYISFFKQL